jgi:ribosomal protein S12 methylthiotransferase
VRKNKIDIITLGCSKNLVDSELLIRQFEANGYTVAHDSEKVNGEIVIVNTCGFIEDAQEESINMILELEEAKRQGKIGKLFVMGCLSERFAEELRSEIKGVDAFYGKFNWKGIINDLGKSYFNDLSNERSISTPAHYAYLKISEGCNRKCSYCSIPIITGKYKSRTIEDLVMETESLADKGVKELQVIAQDLTYYGKDIYRKYALPELIEKLSDIKGIEWIRLHYAYPTDFPADLLRVMRERDNVCKYLDIALQHISDKMLKLMRRNITKKETYELINNLREKVPGIYLRTTLMVGHPGETEEDFEELKKFVKEMRFERMGSFIYSHESETYSYLNYKDDIPAEVKQSRIDELMEIQKEISSETNESMISKTFKTIIDRKEGDYYIGRTQYDSPEIDPEVLIKSDKRLKTGNFYNVTVDKADAFELYGSIRKKI